ncbi:MAG: crotonase/enoyl-CoA hydratase family protein [Kofleriaceae bacterium]
MSESPSTAPALPTPSWATVTLDGHVAEVVLRATGKASRMGLAFWQEMPALFAALDAAADVRAIVLRGEGEGFSYGLDLGGMGADLAQLMAPGGGAAERTRLHEMITRLQRAITCVASCTKPVIAAIHGWCIGGGVDLATACDVRVCSADAKFSVREVRLAMVADVGTLARLPLIIGEGATRELALTGDDIDAVRALRLGLVNDVLETHDALLAHARAMAARIAANPPLVVRGVKQVLNARSERIAEESLRTVALWNSAFLPSQDLGEAMAAFVQRRPPAFKGR